MVTRDRPNIFVITGPTASGKTALALALARRIPAEIVSADSRQVFTRLDIGTAKPSRRERTAVVHHCIDIVPPDQRFSAGDFQRLGRAAVDEIVSRHRLPVVVGGTGLYVRALVDGFFDVPELSGDVRASLESRLAQEGKEALYRELVSVDPASAATMDASKHRRVIRALEVFYETGVPISDHHQRHQADDLYNATFAGLLWDRAALYARIEQRVDAMLAAGFLDEVRSLLAVGLDDRYQALQTVGYKEAFQHLRGEISYDRMMELMKQNTRRFAKRQMTWFRNENRIVWYPVHSDQDIDDVAEKIVSELERQRRLEFP